MYENYFCSICGKHHVKLWRPYGYAKPLICATCAEQLQTPLEYDEVTWNKTGPNEYHGKCTGKKLPFPRWTVKDNGTIPSSYPGPKGASTIMTDQLIIQLKIQSGPTDMIPAIPDEYENYWSYHAVPEEKCMWWESLPTR